MTTKDTTPVPIDPTPPGEDDPPPAALEMATAADALMEEWTDWGAGSEEELGWGPAWSPQDPGTEDALCIAGRVLDVGYVTKEDGRPGYRISLETLEGARTIWIGGVIAQALGGKAIQNLPVPQGKKDTRWGDPEHIDVVLRAFNEHVGASLGFEFIGAGRAKTGRSAPWVFRVLRFSPDLDLRTLARLAGAQHMHRTAAASPAKSYTLDR